MWQVVSVITLLVAVGADTESGLITMIKAPFGIVWTLVGAATPFSTWSLTRPHAWTHGASGFPLVGALGNADARAGSKTTSGARPAAGPCSCPGLATRPTPTSP